VAKNVGSSITVIGGYSFGSISDNGDGTATVSVGESTYDNGFLLFVLSGVDPANTSYSKTANILPGASGKQTGSGSGSASLTGDIINYGTFTDTPVAISFAMTMNQAGASITNSSPRMPTANVNWPRSP